MYFPPTTILPPLSPFPFSFPIFLYLSVSSLSWAHVCGTNMWILKKCLVSYTFRQWLHPTVYWLISINISRNSERAGKHCSYLGSDEYFLMFQCEFRRIRFIQQEQFENAYKYRTSKLSDWFKPVWIIFSGTVLGYFLSCVALYVNQRKSKRLFFLGTPLSSTLPIIIPLLLAWRDSEQTNSFCGAFSLVFSGGFV